MHFSVLPALCMCTMWVLSIEPKTVQEQHMLGTTEPSLLSLKVHTFQQVYNISFNKYTIMYFPILLLLNIWIWIASNILPLEIIT